MDPNVDERNLQATLRNLISESETLMASIGEEGSQRYRDAVAAMRRQIQHAQDELEDLQYTAIRRARLMARRTDRYVHDNPWRTAGVAAAVGAAVGAAVAILIARR